MKSFQKVNLKLPFSDIKNHNELASVIYNHS